MRRAAHPAAPNFIPRRLRNLSASVAITLSGADDALNWQQQRERRLTDKRAAQGIRSKERASTGRVLGAWELAARHADPADGGLADSINLRRRPVLRQMTGRPSILPRRCAILGGLGLVRRELW